MTKVLKRKIKNKSLTIHKMDAKLLVMNALKSSQNVLPKLFDIINNPQVNDSYGIAKDTVLFIYESQHDWDAVTKYVKQWEKWGWATDFIQRMR